mmetsp:Transcript_1148/g.1711  ORF Transcript_1148/g.1711 Transcript_1148/m.1711 type:complete len:102 (+) Transcript_1148:1312-1617(+)
MRCRSSASYARDLQRASAAGGTLHRETNFQTAERLLQEKSSWTCDSRCVACKVSSRLISGISLDSVGLIDPPLFFIMPLWHNMWSCSTARMGRTVWRTRAR